MRYTFLLICFILSVSLPKLHAQQGAQSKTQLEAKRKEIQEAIAETEHELAEIKKNKNATLSQLRTLQYKLAQRQTLIDNINDEIGSIDHSIATSSKEILTLKQKLELLKIKYAQTIRYSYESRSSYDMIAFLFSSGDFNDAVRRMKYLKNFREYRKQQVSQIHQTEDEIGHKIKDLNKVKEEKDDLLITQKNQNKELVNDVKETQTVVQGLKGQENELKKEAENNRRKAAKINSEINSIINKEMAAARKRGNDAEKKRLAAGNNEDAGASVKTGGKIKTKIPKTENVALMLTPTDVALANNFAGNKGKLYWPVTQGFIVDHFGRHTSPLSKYVTVDNDGIDIRTSPNAHARAVFEGNVSRVITVEGFKVVVIQHGNYFTVYNNLASASVSKGQHVNTLQTIGEVAENVEGEPTIVFQIWKSNGNSSTKLNPELWLGKTR